MHGKNERKWVLHPSYMLPTEPTRYQIHNPTHDPVFFDPAAKPNAQQPSKPNLSPF